VALVIALGLVAVMAIVMLVFLGLERGPQPADLAVSYELAWQRRDWSTLFDLSAAELRDGLARDEFVAAKRAGDEKVPARPEPRPVLVDAVTADTHDAVVVTRVDGSGAPLRHAVTCARRNGRWQVVSHHLVADES
jgi:hypothetical protein